MKEKIREGLFGLIKEADLLETPEEEVWERNLTDAVLAYLDSMGVAVKVEGKPPELDEPLSALAQGKTSCQWLLLDIPYRFKEAGFTAWESLV